MTTLKKGNVTKQQLSSKANVIYCRNMEGELKFSLFEVVALVMILFLYV